MVIGQEISAELNLPTFQNDAEIRVTALLDIYYSIFMVSPFKFQLDEKSNQYFLRKSALRQVCLQK